jgi:NADH-quinone oxidoreductase subunit M
MSALTAGPPIISLVTFLPLAGAALLVFLREGSGKAVRIAALVVSLLTFAASLVLFFSFDGSSGLSSSSGPPG